MDDFVLMNDALEQAHLEIANNYTQPKYPVSFIISQPRAASSLFIQLLFTRYSIGYSSNLISKFWKAPSFGASLHKKLELETQGTNFSTGLATEGAFEPHEWGYFWRYWLKLSGEEHHTTKAQDIDTLGLAKTIAAMEDRFEAPKVFDSPFFHCNYDVISKSIHNAMYIRIWREPFFICNSIINARIQRHGNVDGFYGNIPKNIEKIHRLNDPIEQIICQVYETEKEIDQVYKNIPDAYKCMIKYPDLVTNPTQTVEQYQQALPVKLITRGIDLPKQLNNRNGPSLIKPQYKKLLCKYFEEYFGYLPHL